MLAHNCARTSTTGVQLPMEKCQCRPRLPCTLQRVLLSSTYEASGWSRCSHTLTWELRLVRPRLRLLASQPLRPRITVSARRLLSHLCRTRTCRNGAAAAAAASTAARLPGGLPSVSQGGIVGDCTHILDQCPHPRSQQCQLSELQDNSVVDATGKEQQPGCVKSHWCACTPNCCLHPP